MSSVERPSDGSLTQSGNSVSGGDLAGRDVNKPNVFIKLDANGGLAEIDRLYLELQTEREAQTGRAPILGELEHFKGPASTSEVIGLEKKLQDANRLVLLAFAERTKEKFAKKLVRLEHFESAQKIYAILLSKAYSNFERFVYPSISTGMPDAIVDELLSEHVVRPIETALGTNQLNIYEDEIHGMIFFLTGNCHIRWN